MNYDASPLFADNHVHFSLDSFSLFDKELGPCAANGFL